MKNKRNSRAFKLLGAFLILLFLIGVITSYFDLNHILFSKETSNSESTSIISKETYSIDTSNEETFSTEIIPRPLEINNDDSKTKSEAEIPESTTISDTEVTIQPVDESSEETSSNTIELSEPVGTIYLTFDDGPSLSTTPQILDILKSNNIQATFFIIDYEYGSERESLVKRAFNEGHTIALHGTSHTYSEIYSSLDALINNFKTLQEKVFTSTGTQSYIIRFPGGSSNTVSKKYCTGIMTEAAEYFAATDFVYFDWNVDSEDAGGANSMKEIYENVTSTIKKGRSNVVLMHDSSSKTYTVEALQSIIDWALAEGYEFKAITERTDPVTHRIAN